MSTRTKTLALACALTTMATSTVALAAADSMGTSGPITAFKHISDSSSYSGNFRLFVEIGGDVYYSGASGFCAAYTQLDADEIALLQQLFIHGIDVTPRYQAGTLGKRCLVGWDS
jgi:hypothetical protein